MESKSSLFAKAILRAQTKAAQIQTGDKISLDWDGPTEATVIEFESNSRVVLQRDNGEVLAVTWNQLYGLLI